MSINNVIRMKNLNIKLNYEDLILDADNKDKSKTLSITLNKNENKKLFNVSVSTILNNKFSIVSDNYSKISITNDCIGKFMIDNKFSDLPIGIASIEIEKEENERKYYINMIFTKNGSYYINYEDEFFKVNIIYGLPTILMHVFDEKQKRLAARTFLKENLFKFYPYYISFKNGEELAGDLCLENIMVTFYEYYNNNYNNIYYSIDNDNEFDYCLSELKHISTNSFDLNYVCWAEDVIKMIKATKFPNTNTDELKTKQVNKDDGTSVEIGYKIEYDAEDAD